MSSSKLRFDGWILDPESGDLERGGARVRLQEQPVQVLRELIAHAGSVVPRERLIALLWPKGVVDFDTGLNTVVHKLRSALGDTSETPRYIETLPRRGYRFIGALEPGPEATPNASAAGHDPAARAEATSSTAMTTAAARRPRSPALALVAALAVAALLTGLYALWRARPGASITNASVRALSQPDLPADVAPTSAAVSPPPHSVAVLPFVDMSERKDQEYFGDGLSEELIYQLSRAPGLYVPARTSSFYFKGRQTTIAEIGKALGVRHVLEGSVRKSGNALRVTVQLIRVDDGRHVWSDTFERQFTDVFKVQDEIANAVAQALKVSLLEENVPRAPIVKDTEAYTLWLQARFYDYQLFNKESELKAVDYYRQVVRLDPTFASGWEGLSRAVAELPLFGAMPWQRGREEALHAAQRALAIDAKLPAAHIALGKVRYVFDFDWPAAQREFDAARALDTHDSYALFWSGQLAATLGHDDDALQLYKQGILQDPLNSFLYQQMGVAYYRQGRITDSVTAARRAVELSPTGAGGHTVLGQALLAAGARDAALEEIERESDDGLREWARARTYWLLGQADRGDSALKRLETEFTENMAYRIAALYALRGNAEQAFYWLDRAFDQRNVGLTVYGGLIHDPDFEKVRHDDRYREFLRKMKLPK